ncbi:amino acid permease-domain-containing protein [Gamsiella multidivaricata]|uniref:amino acid permease-domain-containing protein n=1 Tax=Gamsiella multidivaricata TaxID=101098 RepID=UPI002220035A|nr:amino acid permease-domain-containing protein [Gamsiella multidivaricata]KAI7819670.1 amino acid permease-domain-containing protein [Gamsiella multidivaricata]
MPKYEVESDTSEKYEIDHMEDLGCHEVLASEQEGLKRDLRLRHMVMIAISGTIGTGLFLTSGSTIATAGPGGAYSTLLVHCPLAVLAYITIGLWLVFVCQAIGEIATLLPLPGAFNAWGGRVFDEALSFQMTWMYFINWALTIPAELSASAVIVGFWLPEDSKFPAWVVPLIIIMVMVIINLVGVKAYGELEYWFSILKVVTIIMFIICGILVDAGVIGGVKYGMSAWHIPGAPFKNGFIGFLTTLVTVGYAYGGTEMTGVTAAESRNPHKHVPKAVNTVMLRIAFFYIISIFLLGSIVHNDDPSLLNANSSAAKAPFTIVFAKAGISAAANYMNAVVFTSVFSAINSDFYVTTRMLLSLSRNGWAHKSIGYTNSRGVPLVALAIVTACSCLSLITIFVGSGVVFQWFVSLIGSVLFQSWILILLLHFRFRYCWRKQGRPVQDLPYVSWGYPYGNILGAVIGVCCIVATCYLSVINPPRNPGSDATPEELRKFKSDRNDYAQGLLGAWFPWVMSTILFFSYKYVRKTKLVKAEEADFDTGRFIPSESDKEDLKPHGTVWKRFLQSMI